MLLLPWFDLFTEADFSSNSNNNNKKGHNSFVTPTQESLKELERERERESVFVREVGKNNF